MDLERVLQRPSEDRGEVLAQLEENQWFDRKSSRTQAKDLAEVLIGFANAEGGTVVIGIHDGQVEGVADSGDRRNDWRQAPVDYTTPPVPANFRVVDCIDSNGQPNELMVVEVEASDRVHTTTADTSFLRIGDETHKLTFDQRRELEFDKGQSNYEATPARMLSRSDLDDDLISDLASRVGHSDLDRLLTARGLRRSNGQITIGAVLLFADSPQAELPEAFVRVLRHRGTKSGTGRRQQLSHDAQIRGPLTHQIAEAQRVIDELMPMRRALGPDGTFTNVGAIPRDAWLEGLVNAVTHRSYSMAGDHIRIEIFDNRLEIESPGRFPGVVDLSDPGSVNRFARNPRIARVLADFQFGQELGEGIRRMFEEMRLAGLAEPQYEQTAGSVRLSLSADPIDAELEERLPPNARDLVRSIRRMDRASTGDLVKATGRSRPTVLRELKALQKEGIVKWVGTHKKDPRAYWRLQIE